MRILIRIILNSLFFLFLSYLFPEYIQIPGFTDAAVVSLLFGLANTFIKPIILLITLPINILTLGLFSIFINAALLYLISLLLGPRFELMGFTAALIAALSLSIFNVLVNWWLKDD